MKERVIHGTAARLFLAAKEMKGVEGPSDVARLLDVVPQSITNWSSRGVSREGALKAQALIGCDATWLLTGVGEMVPSGLKHESPLESAEINDQTKRVIAELLPSDKGNLVTWEKPDDLEPDSDRVWIDRYDYRYSAGNGVIQWEVRQKKALPFDIGFFKALGVRPQDCKLAQVHGRSMEPYLFNRDMMMICTAKTRVKDGLIYAVTFEDEPLVKQIFKEPEGALRLHSYNSEYPDKIISAEQLEGLQIAGEVVYRSGSGLAGGN
ncbi:LexA family transcriptional regulator [Paraburkholderia sp.]|uniref:S24 family peptidase n=1 Tax=Paraburkholderia sp. TaxID=1926495 RepID=UPI00239DD482|nr:LexA family transcriptional regulator [Paraburkholderia sp.]MDE1179467.1 S24 family peptidase [Paraburkholderia sp.]